MSLQKYAEISVGTAGNNAREIGSLRAEILVAPKDLQRIGSHILVERARIFLSKGKRLQLHGVSTTLFGQFTARNPPLP